jgi:enoyl-CoA hydratase
LKPCPSVLLIDDPLPGVRRLTMNRPEKRNALNNALRGAIFDALATGRPRRFGARHRHPRRGARLQRGYDLSADNSKDQPYQTAGGIWPWSRHVWRDGCACGTWPSR